MELALQELTLGDWSKSIRGVGGGGGSEHLEM